MLPIVTLRHGSEKSMKRRHPWVFSGAIHTVEGSPEPGETVIVKSSQGLVLGTGSYSPVSQIRVRMWSFDPERPIDSRFFEEKISQAVQSRNYLKRPSTNAYRIINAESDGLPGLIVDRYDDHLVCQFLSAGSERWKETIADVLEHQFNTEISCIYERSDTDARQKEGLRKQTGPLRKSPPKDSVSALENGNRYYVDIKQGHKTGFYLDQRDNRAILADYCRDKSVLNCFSYTGGFCISALKGGASSVMNIDASNDALTILESNIGLNDLDAGRCETLCGDVFQTLRKFRDSGVRFDVIILDPPKFAHTSHQISKAARGYKDINLLALKMLSPGGFLFTFSCSGHISSELFQKIVADAALDSNREVQLVRYLHQADDHPIALNFPEALYLKGLICRAR